MTCLPISSGKQATRGPNRPGSPVASLRVVAAIIGWLKGRSLVVLGAIGAIVFFSLLPGYWQERTGLPPPLEHVIALFWRGRLDGERCLARTEACKGYVVVLACLSACMEYLQHFSPGRDPRLADVMWTLMGAVLGTGFVLLVGRVVRRKTKN